MPLSFPAGWLKSLIPWAGVLFSRGRPVQRCRYHGQKVCTQQRRPAIHLNLASCFHSFGLPRGENALQRNSSQSLSPQVCATIICAFSGVTKMRFASPLARVTFLMEYALLLLLMRPQRAMLLLQKTFLTSLKSVRRSLFRD